MERAKKALDSKQRHPYDDGISKRGGGENLYFKSGKDAFMSSNLKALHTYFYLLQENPQKKKKQNKTKGKKREREKKSLS